MRESSPSARDLMRARGGGSSRGLGWARARDGREEEARQARRRGGEGRRRALPDRRQLARLPRLLRPAGVDRDRRRAPDERDLRLRLDDGQAAHRLQAEERDRRLGRGLVGPREGVQRVQGAAQVAAGPAQGAVAAPGAAGRGVRVRQRQGRRLRGRRRDRHPGAALEGGRNPGDGRLRRPRRLPARRGRDPGDDHLARGDRHPHLRPRRRRRALRDPARAGARPDRAQGRHLRQHPRRPGDRRQDRRPAAAEVRVAGGGAGVGRRDQRRQAQGEPDRARRRRPRLEAARDAPVRRRRSARPGRDAAGGPRPLAPARGRRRVRAAAGDPAARGRVRRAGPRARGLRDDRGRGGGGKPVGPRRGRDRARDCRRPLGRRRRRAGRHRRRRRPRRARRRAARPAARRARPQGPRRARRGAGCSPPPGPAGSTSPTTRWSPPT